VQTDGRAAMNADHAGTGVPAWGGEGDGPPGAVTLVLSLRRRRARARGVYLLNARRARQTSYSDWRRRNAGTSNALAASSLSA
jgi:hypothetical protein